MFSNFTLGFCFIDIIALIVLIITLIACWRQNARHKKALDKKQKEPINLA